LQDQFQKVTGEVNVKYLILQFTKKTISGPDEHYKATADIETSPDMPKREYEILFFIKIERNSSTDRTN